MECVLLRATIADTHCIVSHRVRFAGHRDSYLAAARLADLVWPPGMGKPVYNAYARARHATKFVRSNSANRCLDQCALLEIPRISHTPNHRLPDSPQQPAGFSLPRLDPSKKRLHSPCWRHVLASRRILPDLRPRWRGSFSRSSHHRPSNSYPAWEGRSQHTAAQPMGAAHDSVRISAHVFRDFLRETEGSPLAARNRNVLHTSSR